MRAAACRRPAGERLYGALLYLYPAGFRAEYGGEMRAAFGEWRRRAARGEGSGLWRRVLGDLARSVPAEWSAELGRRRRARRRGWDAGAPRPPYGAAVLAGLAVLLIYAVTLAPATGFWDSGEYLTAAHSLGIAHPPGSPLFVLLGHAWESLLAGTGLVAAVRLNLFTACLSAGAAGFWFLVVDRTLAGAGGDRLLRRLGAAAAVAISATAFTVWNQSDVTEKVYGISFFTTALASWMALRWRDTGRRTEPLVGLVFLVALTATNHLRGVLVVPALLLFVWLVDGGALLRPRLWIGGAALGALALSVQLFLPIRAAERPVLAEGEPTCASAAGAVASVYTWGAAGCPALSAEIRREQYGKPSILLDPTVYPGQVVPRSAALLASQLENYIQYFDWQWARSVAGHRVLFGGARPLVTLVFLLLGLAGAWTHRRRDAAGAAYLATRFLTLSLGLVVYMNFKYGYAIGRDRVADPAFHEVRERDYFFLIGFSVWGLWAGMGVATLWRRAAEWLGGRLAWPRLAAAPLLLVALVPLALNWRWASRADDYTARDWAYNVLMSVEPYGVLFTNGDNDTFPLWYAQEVEGVRRDVTVIVSSYLRTPWYARQIRDLTRPCPAGVDPTATPTRILCQRPFERGQLPPALVEAGWTRSLRPPRDSVVRLTDGEIDRIAGSAFVAPETIRLHAGAIDTTIDAGTQLLPEDLFTAAILEAALGERPIHFMPGSPAVTKLGLFAHTVREGITWRIRNAPASSTAPGVVPLPETPLSPVAGAAVDLPLTDTLTWDVYLRRGRILDAATPWPDAASTNIPMQYVYTHAAAAQAHAALGDAAGAERHMLRARWWQSIGAE